MKVFLDTNVLVSATATRGLCADVLREVLTHHQLGIAEPLLAELRNAFCKKLGVPEDLVCELVEILQKDSLFSTCSPPLDIDLQDRDDVIILSCALNGKANLFITGDKKLLDLGKIGSMEIVSPRVFWEKLKAQPPDKLWLKETGVFSADSDGILEESHRVLKSIGILSLCDPLMQDTEMIPKLSSRGLFDLLIKDKKHRVS